MGCKFRVVAGDDKGGHGRGHRHVPNFSAIQRLLSPSSWHRRTTQRLSHRTPPARLFLRNVSAREFDWAPERRRRHVGAPRGGRHARHARAHAAAAHALPWARGQAPRIRGAHRTLAGEARRHPASVARLHTPMLQRDGLVPTRVRHGAYRARRPSCFWWKSAMATCGGGARDGGWTSNVAACRPVNLDAMPLGGGAVR